MGQRHTGIMKKLIFVLLAGIFCVFLIRCTPLRDVLQSNDTAVSTEDHTPVPAVSPKETAAAGSPEETEKPNETDTPSPASDPSGKPAVTPVPSAGPSGTPSWSFAPSASSGNSGPESGSEKTSEPNPTPASSPLLTETPGVSEPQEIQFPIAP